MDLSHLRQFVTIVDAGSVQAAARQLGVSRSVLRRGLDELERASGARLLHRDPSGVRLTAAGAVALERGRPLVESGYAWMREVRSAEREPRGLIRVILPVGMPQALAVDTLLAGREALPHQEIVLRHSEDPLSDLKLPFELMLHEGPPPTATTGFRACSRTSACARWRRLATSRAAASRPQWRSCPNTTFWAGDG